MATIREKIPITYFEKVKAALDTVCPKFFEQAVPDISLIEKASDFGNRNIHNFSEAERKRWREAVPFLYIRDVIHFENNRDIMSEAVAFIKQVAAKGAIQLTGEDAKRFFDMMWLADSPHTRKENGDIDTITSDVGKNSLDRGYWTFHRFNRYGKKTFRIEEQLTHELYLTDVFNVDSDFLHLPFPCICLYLPFNDKLFIRKELVRYIYISERVIVGGDNDGARILELIYISDGHTLSAQQFEITSGNLFEQIIEQVYSKYESELAIRETKAIISFVLGALLYANSADASKQQVFSFYINKKQDSRFPVCSLGYGIKIDKGLHYTQNPETIGLGKPMNVLKWTVRGHFRTYKAGEYYKENKTIWIRPYLKGRERENDSQGFKPTNYIVE